MVFAMCAALLAIDFAVSWTKLDSLPPPPPRQVVGLFCFFVIRSQKGLISKLLVVCIDINLVPFTLAEDLGFDEPTNLTSCGSVMRATLVGELFKITQPRPSSSLIPEPLRHTVSVHPVATSEPCCSASLQERFNAHS